ncbi:MAG: glycosyltransferase family 25 protein [Desulfuromonadales bacterium]
MFETQGLMEFKSYVINLEHASARWHHMRKQLEAIDLPYERIEGVYGNRLSDDVEGYHESRYHLLTGKETNKREIGCYFSHIKALKTFLDSQYDYALILEDDATLPKDIKSILTSAIPHGENWDMLRLTSSREGGFLPFTQIYNHYQLAYNLKVLKNTAAYFVNRHAAMCCVEKMLPMCLPYDVALDRDWDFGFKTACIIPFPVKLEEDFPGQIPKAGRIPFYRATTFHLFHFMTRLQRQYYRKRYFRKAMKRS